MATITFTLEEIHELLKTNDVLPKQVVKTEIKEGSIHFAISTDMFLVPFVPASLKYISYENNTLKLELSVGGGKFNKALGFFTKSLESKVPDFVKLELPYLNIDLDKILKLKNINGLRIKEITQTSDNMTIVTENM